MSDTSKLKKKVILVVAAHPDDPEFGCGGTTAKFAQQGFLVYYLICTGGQRGSRQQDYSSGQLQEKRHQEQENAAKILGVKEVFFLDREDGNLIADISLKEDIVKIIRKVKPDKVFTHDPHWIYSVNEEFAFINHNDHRVAGIATIDAIYPLARDLASFPSHREIGLEPHKVAEIYLFNSDNSNHYEDISNHFEAKYQAITSHQSQIDDPKKMKSRMRKRASKIGSKAGYKYAEGFIKLVLR